MSAAPFSLRSRRWAWRNLRPRLERIQDWIRPCIQYSLKALGLRYKSSRKKHHESSLKGANSLLCHAFCPLFVLSRGSDWPSGFSTTSVLEHGWLGSCGWIFSLWTHFCTDLIPSLPRLSTFFESERVCGRQDANCKQPNLPCAGVSIVLCVGI
jgi:hypothetical protein